MTCYRCGITQAVAKAWPCSSKTKPHSLLAPSANTTNSNRIAGVTPAGSTTMGDVLEGMAEFLCSRWYELASRSIQNGLPSFESPSTDVDVLVGPAEFLRVAVPEAAYWSPGKRK